MPPRVLDEHGSRVEAHGLVVQDGRGEDRQVVELQPRRGIGDQCEAGGMGLREAIERKRADGADDLFLRMGVNVVGVHAGPELDLECLHLVRRPAATESAPQFFGLTASEVRNHHGDAQKLFLEERNAQRAAQHWFKQRVRVAGELVAHVFHLEPVRNLT